MLVHIPYINPMGYKWVNFVELTWTSTTNRKVLYFFKLVTGHCHYNPARNMDKEMINMLVGDGDIAVPMSWSSCAYDIQDIRSEKRSVVLQGAHLEKWWSSSMGRMTSQLLRKMNNPCSKPPTSHTSYTSTTEKHRQETHTEKAALLKVFWSWIPPHLRRSTTTCLDT